MTNTKIFSLFILITLISLFLFPINKAYADIYNVDVFYDAYDANPGDGICADGTGSCTLRAAVEEANLNAGSADTIYFANPGTYTVTWASIPVTDRLTVQGSSQRDIIIEGNLTDIIFDIYGLEITATFNDLTIKNGYSAIRSNYAAVNVNDCLMFNNIGFSGAAIKATNGFLTINDSTLTNNTTSSWGGAIVLDETELNINNSELAYNTSGQGGGAIYVFYGEDFTITNSYIHHNVAASGSGGAIYYAGIGTSVNIDNVNISYNEASNSSGGLFLGHASSISITNSLITNNLAMGSGYAYQGAGGLALAAAQGPMSVLIADTRIAGNETYMNGGGIRAFFSVDSHVINIVNSDISKNSAKNIGGAIFNYADLNSEAAAHFTLNISDSNIEQNAAYDNGAIYAEAANINITRSGINENYAEDNLSKQVELVGGLLDISNSTLSSNKAYSVITVDHDLVLSTGSMGSVVNLHSVTIAENSGYGIVNNLSGKQFYVANSLLADNQMNEDCYGDFYTLEYNFIGINPTSCSGFSASSNDIVGTPSTPVNALLTTLDFYGGNTRLHEWSSASPVNSSSTNCLSEDQQGNSRSDTCDRGSREL
jgi:large repetitive protein